MALGLALKGVAVLPRVNLLYDVLVGQSLCYIFPCINQFDNLCTMPQQYCLISLTLPVDLCLYMGFLIAWRMAHRN